MPADHSIPSCELKQTLACLECGATFEAFPSAHRRFCSKPCYWKHRRDKPEGSYGPPSRASANEDRVPNSYIRGMVSCVCLQCGRTEERYASQVRRFCSHQCSLAHRRANKTALKPRRGKFIPCKTCGMGFYVSPGQIKIRLYCSKTCHDADQTIATDRTCAVCGKVFKVRPSRGPQKHCSHACQKSTLTKRPLSRLHNGKPARLNQSGYVMVWEPSHPSKTHKGWHFEHRLVVEREIGRYLRSDEAIHHKDGLKTNNDPNNLEIMDVLDHATLSAREYRDSVADKIAELEAYRARFGPLIDS